MKRHAERVFFCVLLLCALVSCGDEPQVIGLRPERGTVYLFADEKADSLVFSTTDSWTVTSLHDWITVVGDAHLDLAHYNTSVHFSVPLLFQPNTTGKTRSGLLHVASNGNDFYAPFVQFGTLEVTYPGDTIESFLDEPNRIPEVARHILNVSSTSTADSVWFNVHNPWQLQYVDNPAPDWLTFDKSGGASGRHRILLTLTENTDSENERTLSLKLTSGEVTDFITVRQAPAKKKEVQQLEEQGGQQ